MLRRSRLPIVALVVLLVAGALATAWGARPAAHERLPQIAAPAGLPGDGMPVAIHTAAGDPWLSISTTFRGLGSAPFRPPTVTAATYEVTVTNVGAELAEFEAADDIWLIDSVRLTRQGNMLAADGTVDLEDDIVVAPGESRTFAMDYGLPETVQPDMLLWYRLDPERSTVAVLHSTSGAIGAVGQDLPTAATATASSVSGNRWVMLPAGITRVEAVEANARTTGNEQYGQVAYSFTNTGDGPFHWFADMVIVVDQTGTGTIRYTEGRTDTPEELDTPLGESGTGRYVVDPGETVSRSVGVEVATGAEIRLVLLVGSRTITVAATGPASGDVDAVFAATYDRVAQTAARHCDAWAGYSADTNETVALMREVLALPFDQVTVEMVPELEDYLARLQERTAIHRELESSDVAGFSETPWLLSLLDQLTGWLEDTVQHRAARSSDPPMMLKSTTWAALDSYIAQFENRMAVMSDWFGIACASRATPVTSPGQ